MENFIFNHLSKSHEEIVLPSKNMYQPWVHNLANRLCNDDIVYINGCYYTHISLPKFLHDMKSLFDVDLKELFASFEKELWNCVLQQTQNMTIGIQEIQEIK